MPLNGLRERIAEPCVCQPAVSSKLFVARGGLMERNARDLGLAGLAGLTMD